ncbi:hypothetical protein [Ideonella sp. BN130291]|uniref:hypothetical protein n=1 Tax=Ideonella sp. BN130291 TaxID=3112940 RepID=UPI002E27436B|nr:hypothetical protein [Ideonella sp. BN130291]
MVFQLCAGATQPARSLGCSSSQASTRADSGRRLRSSAAVRKAWIACACWASSASIACGAAHSTCSNPGLETRHSRVGSDATASQW